MTTATDPECHVVTLDEETARWATYRSRKTGHERIQHYWKHAPSRMERPRREYRGGPSQVLLPGNLGSFAIPAKNSPLAMNSMSGTVFVDTNVLVYVRDRTELDKRRRAAEWIGPALWDTRRETVEVQVIFQEYYW